MKNKKLNLNELRVKSFVTEFDNGTENTLKGGTLRTFLVGGCGATNPPTVASCPGPCQATFEDCTTINESNTCTIESQCCD